MAFEHPVVTLDIGTLKSNTMRALGQDEDAVQKASWTKRECQLLIRQLVDCITADSHVSVADRNILDALCPRVPVDNREAAATNSPDGEGNASTGSIMADNLPDPDPVPSTACLNQCRRRQPPFPDEPNKLQLAKALNWEHPTSTLDIGTVSANLRGALMNPLHPLHEDVLVLKSEAELSVVASEVER
ncbi:hypothetical protein BGX31_003822, partial [Mortierella sp. GBA43]